MDAKAIVIITLFGAAVALGACRREVPYEPLKLGAAMPPATQPLR